MTLIAMTKPNFDPARDSRFLPYRHEAIRLLLNAPHYQEGYKRLRDFVLESFESLSFDATDLYMRVLAVCKAEGPNPVPTIAHMAKLFGQLKDELIPEKHLATYKAVCHAISRGICQEISAMCITAMTNISHHMGVDVEISMIELPDVHIPGITDDKKDLSSPSAHGSKLH